MLPKLALGAALGVLVAAAAVAGPSAMQPSNPTSKANKQALCAVTHDCGYAASDSSLPSGSKPVVGADDMAGAIAELQRKVGALADCVYQHHCRYELYLGQ